MRSSLHAPDTGLLFLSFKRRMECHVSLRIWVRRWRCKLWVHKCWARFQAISCPTGAGPFEGHDKLLVQEGTTICRIWQRSMSSLRSGSIRRMCSTLTLAVDGTHTANVFCVHQIRPAVSNLRTLRRDVLIDLGVLMGVYVHAIGIEKWERKFRIYMSEMTLNYRVVVERHPFPNVVVGDSTPAVKFSLCLMKKSTEVGRKPSIHPRQGRQQPPPSLHQEDSWAG